MEARPDPIEARNDALHRRVAALIRQDPSVVLRARDTLDRWLATEPLPAWLEWRDALRLLTPEEIASFLESTTPRARRMRSSSPFASLLRSAPEHQRE
jgi:hypothetical protein